MATRTKNLHSSRIPLGEISTAVTNKNESRMGQKRKDGAAKGASRVNKRQSLTISAAQTIGEPSAQDTDYLFEVCPSEDSTGLESMNVTGPLDHSEMQVYDVSEQTPMKELSSELNMHVTDSPCNVEAARDSERRLPEGCVDIDEDDDPQMVSDLMEEIVAHYRERERAHRVTNINYLETLQPDVNHQMRAILVDWLVEVGEEYNLRSDTLFLTVNLVDRFLAIERVERGALQLVGITAMLIASKYQEIYPPSIQKFVYISDNTYTVAQVIRMEEVMLNALEFNLTVVTPKCFLRRFVKAACADLPMDQSLLENFHYLSSYITELTLQEYSFVKYLPSTIATSAVVIALMTLEHTPWTPTLEFYTQQSHDDRIFLTCLQELFHVFSGAPESRLQAIREKYSHERFGGIAARVNPPIMKSYQ